MQAPVFFRHTSSDEERKALYDEPWYSGENEELGIPGIRYADGPAGIVHRGGATGFTVAIGRAASWDCSLEEKVGGVFGTEAKIMGANCFGGVCVNLLRHPAWGRAQECYGEDTFLTGMMASAVVRGVQKHIMACAKHFLANNIEENRFRQNVEMDERTLREIYLPHFKRLVDEGIACIMPSYNMFRGVHCCENIYSIRQILKGEWSFQGFTMSDWVYGITDGKMAINAGTDIEMPSPQYMGHDLIQYVKSGEVGEELIDEAVLRILKQQIKYAQIASGREYPTSMVACKTHTELSKKAAQKSMVLLKNDHQALPLDGIKKLAVVGRLADQVNLGDQHGSSCICPAYAVTPLEGIKSRAGCAVDVIYTDGSDVEAAVKSAREADAVIMVVGLTTEDEGEYLMENCGRSADRVELGLHREDIDLINRVADVNCRCIICVEGGSAIMMEHWKDKVQAILMMWYPGMEGGNALAEILFGDFNPCAKLPFTIPASQDQLPRSGKDAEQVVYDYYHGYYLADKYQYSVTYHFGYGLSYTTYEYNNLRISKGIINKDEAVEVQIDVKNTGSIAGEEIVQMYAGYLGSNVERHIKDLKGFAKVYLKPGETKTVKFILDAAELAYYKTEERKWVVENIEYQVYAGSSSRKEDLLVSSFQIK